MNIHLVRKETIEDYVKANAQSRLPFQDWLNKLKYNDWEIPGDMQATLGLPICWAKVRVGSFSM